METRDDSQSWGLVRMMVDEQFRKSVGFLVSEGADADENAVKNLVGTVFFVVMTYETSFAIVYVVYAVTARHVIESARPYGMLRLWVNRVKAAPYGAEVPPELWTLNTETDVAVLNVSALGNMRGAKVDWNPIPGDMIADDDIMVSIGIGEGDEVFFATMSQGYVGTDRFRPMVRFGHISLMPYEPVPVSIDPGSPTTTTNIDAYLVEAQSWGGESGAPAFVVLSPDRIPGSMHIDRVPVKLLGLVQGHFKIAENVESIGDILGSATVDINPGIAVVIPASKIYETLMYEVLMDERRELAAEEGRKASEPQE